MPVTHPYVEQYQQRVPGEATAGSDKTVAIGRAPYAGVVSRVAYAAEGALAGHATNNRVLSLVNKGQAGAGTTVIATITTTAAPDNSLVAYDEKVVPLHATPANLVVAEGDILAWVSDAQASGVVDPGGLVSVNVDRS